MGSAERRQREKDEVRTRIVDAARRIFAEEGYEHASMRRIAEAIEYSPTAIYVHFKDKQALLTRIIREDFARLAEAFVRIARVDDPVERIRRAGREYVRFAHRHPHHYRLMFMTAADAAPDADGLADRGNPDADSYAFLQHAVRDAKRQGRFRDGLDDPELLAQVLWSGVHGIASLEITKRDDPWIDWRSLERRTDLMIDALLRGLLAPTPAKRGRA